MLKSYRFKVGSSLLVVGMLCVVGCAGESAETAPPSAAGAGDADHADHEDHAENTEHDHSGWWCDEHGVPEGECTRCSAKLVAQFKEKGDWCEEHQRPDSQCFLCKPELQAKFAARYEAKLGKLPPEPTDP